MKDFVNENAQTHERKNAECPSGEPGESAPPLAEVEHITVYTAEGEPLLATSLGTDEIGGPMLLAQREQLRRIAQEVCTQRELDALAYAFAGSTANQTALALGITPRAVRHRLDSAARKIASHPDYQEPR